MDALPQYVVTIGDIGVTNDEIVTPNGRAKLKGSQWIVTDQSTVSTAIPPYAIVLAIIFAFACLLGLLFLLIKETRYAGYINVSVLSEKLHHQTQVPVVGPLTRQRIAASVAQVQSMAAAAA